MKEWSEEEENRVRRNEIEADTREKEPRTKEWRAHELEILFRFENEAEPSSVHFNKIKEYIK